MLITEPSPGAPVYVIPEKIPEELLVFPEMVLFEHVLVGAAVPLLIQ
jgi:hypothetical protein